jgi:flavin reductase (DIM6/NTAB) family NADH-FMN oxidoreductase RutF
MVETAKLAGSKSGRDIDKFEISGEEWFVGRFRKLPILRKAVANFECEIVTQVKSGDHTIYVGEVKHSWINKEQDNVLTIKDF